MPAERFMRPVLNLCINFGGQFPPGGRRSTASCNFLFRSIDLIIFLAPCPSFHRQVVRLAIWLAIWLAKFAFHLRSNKTEIFLKQLWRAPEINLATQVFSTWASSFTYFTVVAKACSRPCLPCLASSQQFKLLT